MAQPVVAATCDIIIPVYDQVDYTRGCLESIFAKTSCPFRLIIVDDHSKKKETLDYLLALQARESDRIMVLHNELNLGYVRTVNHGLRHTSAEFVVVMNNDTIVYDGWLSEMIAIARLDPSIGIVNPQWKVPKRFKGDRERFFVKDVAFKKGAYVEIGWARGFCYLTKRRVIDRINGLDEDFAPAYFDDWDYSMRAIAAGYRCVQALGAFVFHFMNCTYSDKEQGVLVTEKRSIFYKRWGRPLRLLIVDDGAIGDVERKVRRLLRDQNKVTLVSSVPITMSHMNLRVVMVHRWLMAGAIFLILLYDIRRSAPKRLHLVLGSGDAVSFLNRVLFFLGNYPVKPMSENNDVVLNELIWNMKFQAIIEDSLASEQLK